MPLRPSCDRRRLGGDGAVVERAEHDFVDGNYRWVVQVLDHVLWADPEHAEARRLAAEAHRQLGFQCENATWRNAYLSAAHELAAQGQPPAVVSRDFSELFAMAPTLSALNYLAIRLDGPRAADEVLTIEWRIRATDEVFTTHLENAVLHTRAGASDAWNIRITAGREALVELVLGRTAIEVIAQERDVSVEGDAARADAFFALLDTFDPWFPLVTHVARRGEGF